MTKKVLILTQNFYPVIGSAGNRMKNIYQLLNNKGIQVDVLTTEPAYPNKNMYKNTDFWDDDTLNNQTDKVQRVPIKNKKFSNKIFSRLFFYIEIMYRFMTKLFSYKKEGYDYILVSTPPIFIVLSAWLGVKLFKCKIILEVRDLWPDSLIGVKAFDNKWIIKFFRLLEKKMYRSADFIIINSEGFKVHIIDKLKDKSKPIVYLPNGPREEEIRYDKQQDDEFRVVYAGNLGLAQDINRLKVIAKKLNQTNIRFDVLGYGMKTKEFTDFLIENELNNVVVHEPTTRKKSLELISKSHLSIAFLNDEEVFSTVLPGKIIDYMTCQTPVIAGVKGTAASIITENKTGYAFDSDDVQLMVEKIIELKSNQKELQELMHNCTTTINKKFLWEKNINDLVEIIK